MCSDSSSTFSLVILLRVAFVHSARSSSLSLWNSVALSHHVRGGSVETPQSLDDRVTAVMERLGLAPSNDRCSDTLQDTPTEPQCEGGVCSLESAESHEVMASRIAAEMNVPTELAMAAIYSSLSGTHSNRQLDERAARRIVQLELDAISAVSPDSQEVKQLVSEGFDPFLSRRALAFSDATIQDARAILLADQQDEAAERHQSSPDPPLPTITVDYPKDFDPLASPPTKLPPQPPAAVKSDVVFEATAQNFYTLVMESPVPVLLDIYADWCQPCQQLTPALEQICIRAGGMLRLVKVNTDHQRTITSALDVTSLPTVFAIRDGKIQNMFQGVPRDEAMVRNFLMGLMLPNQPFVPPVTSDQRNKYEEYSDRLWKVTATSSLSYPMRERLEDRINKDMKELVRLLSETREEAEVGMAVAEDSARVLRTLLSNVIGNPFETKFRKIKLDNPVIASKVTAYAPCVSILKSLGFVPDSNSTMVVAKGKRVVNIGPFLVARDSLDKWIDKNRHQIAAAKRRRIDKERLQLVVEAEERRKEVYEDNLDDMEEDGNSEQCIVKLRIEGKNKIHEIVMDVNDPLSLLLEKLPLHVEKEQVVQLICAAKRLIIKSTDTEQMQKSLLELGLTPIASIVAKLGMGKSGDMTKTSLLERAATAPKKKTGSHSMHSIGLYAKDDGNKAELFDGGGGVLYEHDVTDDEDDNNLKQRSDRIDSLEAEEDNE